MERGKFTTIIICLYNNVQKWLCGARDHFGKALTDLERDKELSMYINSFVSQAGIHFACKWRPNTHITQ